MPQTSYSIIHAAAYEGNIAESGFTDKRSGRNNDVVEIPYGRFVAVDTGAGTTALAVRLPANLTDVMRGIFIYDHAHEPQTSGAAVGDLMNIMQKGVVWMLLEQDCTLASDVYVRTSVASSPTGTAPALGKVRVDADPTGGLASVNRAVKQANAKFLDAGLAGTLVRVQINMPA